MSNTKEQSEELYLRELHTHLARQAIANFSQGKDPSSLSVYSKTKNQTLDYVTELPESLRRFVFNGENTEKTFLAISDAYLKGNTASKKEFQRQYQKVPYAVTLVTMGQRKVQDAPLVARQADYEPCLLVCIHTREHKLFGWHPISGKTAFYNTACAVAKR